MLDLFSSKKTINLVIDDYAIRMVDHAGGDLAKVKSYKEKAIPTGLLEHGRILDEMEFYHFIKATVQDWGIKRRNVQFYVPDSLVIMKTVQFPASLKDNEVKGYFYMELGRTLYLPFDNPIFDVYPFPIYNSEQTTREGLLFAVPEEELNKYTSIFEDAGLKPIAADIRSIGIFRYYQSITRNFNSENAYLFLELNLNSILISIFSENKPEFLRFLDLDVPIDEWKATDSDNGSIQWVYDGDEQRFLGLLDDQVVELERIMNFYRYSLHKGEKMVAEIVLLGDFPGLSLIRSKLEKSFSISVQVLDEYQLPNKNIKIPRAYIPALGLALKGEVK